MQKVRFYPRALALTALMQYSGLRPEARTGKTDYNFKSQVLFTPFLGVFSSFLHSTCFLSVIKMLLQFERGFPLFKHDNFTV